MGLEFKMGSTVEFWSLSLSVSGLVEQRVRERALLLGFEFGTQRACAFGLEGKI